MRDVVESEDAEDEGAVEVSDAAAAPADVAEADSICEEFELDVVSLGAFIVEVLVTVTAAGRGGQRLPDASSTPRNPPGMKLKSVDELQHEAAVELLQQYVGFVP